MSNKAVRLLWREIDGYVGKMKAALALPFENRLLSSIWVPIGPTKDELRMHKVASFLNALTKGMWCSWHNDGLLFSMTDLYLSRAAVLETFRRFFGYLDGFRFGGWEQRGWQLDAVYRRGDYVWSTSLSLAIFDPLRYFLRLLLHSTGHEECYTNPYFNVLSRRDAPASIRDFVPGALGDVVLIRR